MEPITKPSASSIYCKSNQHLQGVQCRMVLVNFFDFFFNIKFCWFFVAIFDLVVHDVYDYTWPMLTANSI